MAGASPKTLIPTSGPLVEARRAYLHDLPELLKSHPGEWVAYRGERRIGFAKSKAEMYAECRRQNLQQDDYLVTCIEPESDFEFMGLGIAESR